MTRLKPSTRLVLPLCPESKANSRVRTRDGRFIKSPKALKFVEDFKLLAMTKRVTLWEPDDKLGLWVRIRYPNYRRDLDDSLIRDALQDCGIVPNDRQFRSVSLDARDETGPPQIEIKIFHMGKLPWKPRTKRQVQQAAKGV